MQVPRSDTIFERKDLELNKIRLFPTVTCNQLAVVQLL